MIRLTTLLLALLPASAHALSCLEFTPADMFRQFESPDLAYVPVIGTLTVYETKRPGFGSDRTGFMSHRIEVPAHFLGVALGPKGTETPIDIDVAYTDHCIAPIQDVRVRCGRAVAKSSKTVLTVLTREKNSYSVSNSLCGGTIFYSPSQEEKDEFRKCASHGRCWGKTLFGFNLSP